MSTHERAISFDFSNEANRKEAHWQRDKNVRDVLAHLYEWHQLLLTWVKDNRSGLSRPFLPSPHTWRTYGKLNDQFWRQHQSTAPGEAERLVRSSHEQVMALIKSFSDVELFEKGRFDWTGKTTLGSYCTSATSSHYEWAMKKIRAHLKKHLANFKIPKTIYFKDELPKNATGKVLKRVLKEQIKDEI